MFYGPAVGSGGGGGILRFSVWFKLFATSTGGLLLKDSGVHPIRVQKLSSSYGGTYRAGALVPPGTSSDPALAASVWYYKDGRTSQRLSSYGSQVSACTVCTNIHPTIYTQHRQWISFINEPASQHRPSL